MNSEFASSTLPTTAGRQNAIPIVMGEEEIRKFILDGRLEPMLGIFLPNAIDDETEKILRKALDSLKTHSALGQTKVLHDLKRNFTAMEQEWLDPRLLQQLAQQPCLIDSAKQTERDFAVFRKFYGDRPQADVNYELIEKLQNERVRKYLQDYDFIRKNPVAAGAYGLQRQLSDKGHAHAMKVAKAANLAFGLASKTASAKQWQGQESNSRLDLQAGGRKDLSMDFPNYSRRDSGVETGRQ